MLEKNRNVEDFFYLSVNLIKKRFLRMFPENRGFSVNVLEWVQGPPKKKKGKKKGFFETVYNHNSELSREGLLKKTLSTCNQG